MKQKEIIINDTVKQILKEYRSWLENNEKKAVSSDAPRFLLNNMLTKLGVGIEIY